VVDAPSAPGTADAGVNDVEVLADGTVAVLASATGEPLVIRRLAPGGAAFGAPVQVDPTEGFGRLALGRDGDLLVAWSDDATPETLRVARLAPGAAALSPAVALASGNVSVADLGVAADGTEAVWWREFAATGDPVALAAYRPPGGAFGAPMPLAPAVQGFHAALAPSGHLIALWHAELAPGQTQVLLGGVDPGDAPVLSGVRAPGTIVAGEPATFLADATDTSGLRAITWSFGDGATGGEGRTEHAYAAPIVIRRRGRVLSPGGKRQQAPRAGCCRACASGPARAW